MIYLETPLTVDKIKNFLLIFKIKPSSMLDQLLPNQDKFLVVEDQQLQEEWMLIHQD